MEDQETNGLLDTVVHLVSSKDTLMLQTTYPIRFKKERTENLKAKFEREAHDLRNFLRHQFPARTSSWRTTRKENEKGIAPYLVKITIEWSA